MPVEAIIFDMDGILVDSEPYWEQCRVEFAAGYGKGWSTQDQHSTMGVSTVEWAHIMQTRLGISTPIDDIIQAVRGCVLRKYGERLPILPGAIEAVRLAASRYKVGLASGSPTQNIQYILKASGLDGVFQVVVYGDTVPRGKPSPDIYLEAARQLGVAPAHCIGVEDSGNGVRSVKAAGMRVLAVPTAAFPLSAEVLAMVDIRLNSLTEFRLDLFKD